MFEPMLSLIAVVALQDASAQGSNWSVSFSSAAAHQFETDLDDGGDFSVSRFGIDAGLDYRFTPELSAGMSIGYGFDTYDFSSSTSIGSDPWEDIHTLVISGRTRWHFADSWTLYGGALVSFSGEDAEWSDAVTGGGLGAVAYRFSDTFSIGGGIGIVSRIEDDAQFFPVIILDWRITDALRLTSASRPTIPSAVNRGGLELIYKPTEQWEFGLGARYDVRRFRLDDSGVAPDGVGEEDSLPVWLRAGYAFNKHIRADFFAGVALLGEMSIADRSGRELADDDYDPAAFVGASVSIQF